jgi:hypothetical protein
MGKALILSTLNCRVPILLFFLLVTANAHAEITDKNEHFNILCVEENSTGFNWGNGNWKQRNFKNNKYLAQKLKIENPTDTPGKKPESGVCFDSIQYRQESKNNTYDVSWGCYNIRAIGSTFYPYNSEVCREIWEKPESGTKYLLRVFCNDLYFNPNGWFHRASLHGATGNKPKDDYKDSLVISVGKCTTF